MTMAVVFQIEGPQDSHQLEHEVKEILNTLQVAEKKESGRPLQEVEAPAETAYRGCAQMAD